MLKGCIRWVVTEEDDVIDFLSSLNYAENYAGVGCAVTGCVGRWDGVHEIVPKHYDEIKDCFNALIFPRYEHRFVLKRTGRWTYRFTEWTHDDPTGRTKLRIVINH